MCQLQNPLVAYLPRVEPNTDPLLFRQQAGFRREKSIVDEAILLTEISRIFCRSDSSK